MMVAKPGIPAWCITIFCCALCIGAREKDAPVHRGSMIALSDKFYSNLLTAGYVLQNDSVQAYTDTVLQTLLQQRPPPPVACRTVVVSHPAVNAFAAPNGTIYLFTGLLARMENEAQLAALLAHELSHIVHDHAYISFTQKRDNRRTLAGVQTGLSVVMGGASGLVGNVMLASAQYGYSRELEREADMEGLERMHRCGYDVTAFRRLFEILAEHAGRSGVRERYFFSTHPRTLERMESFDTWYDGQEAITQGTIQKEPFYSVMKPVIEGMFRYLLAGGDNSLARKYAGQLVTETPHDAQLHALTGDSYRREGTRPDSASWWYHRALQLDTANQDAIRGCVLLYSKMGNRDSAQLMIHRYQAVFPDAFDRDIMQGWFR